MVAKVRAQNAIGWSGYSIENTGPALVRTIPTQMAAPTRGGSTTDQKIHVVWSPLTEDASGKSTVLSYILQKQDGSSWTDLVGVSSPYTSLEYELTGLS